MRRHLRPYHKRSRHRLRRQLEGTGTAEQVIAAVMQVPREEFVPDALRGYAWADESLPIGDGQTISQPSLVGRMTDYLRLEPGHCVLDIGTGSGYQAAILSLLAEKVISVERIPALCVSARARLSGLGYTNIDVFEANPELGWPELAPYDGIVVGAAAPGVPSQLTQQLKIGARLVIPVGSQSEQQLAVVQRTDSGVKEMRYEWVRFVPLIGEGAWRNAQDD